MSRLELSPRLDDPDGLFEALVEAHRGLDPADSRRLDAKIILILANHIGSVAIVREAIAAALNQTGENPSCFRASEAAYAAHGGQRPAE